MSYTNSLLPFNEITFDSINNYKNIKRFICSELHAFYFEAMAFYLFRAYGHGQ